MYEGRSNIPRTTDTKIYSATGRKREEGGGWSKIDVDLWGKRKRREREKGRQELSEGGAEYIGVKDETRRRKFAEGRHVSARARLLSCPRAPLLRSSSCTLEETEQTIGWATRSPTAAR